MTSSNLKTKEYTISLQARASFDYSKYNPQLMQLYNKAKDSQWDARTVVNWDEAIDPENPLSLPESAFPLARSSWYIGLSPSKKVDAIRQYHAWMVSQFLHGEQFGILTSSRIALEACDHESKFFASVQSMDEARHLEAYGMLSNKIGIRYDATKPFQKFLDDVLCAKEIDLVYLGLQIIGEGIGLASFHQIRKYTTSPLIAELYARIMEDEARHVAFGRRFLAPLYQSLSQREMQVREEFCAQTLDLMGERFYALELWESLGLCPEDARVALKKSPSFRIYKKELFSHIIPIIKDIGLWYPEIQRRLGALI